MKISVIIDEGHGHSLEIGGEGILGNCGFMNENGIYVTAILITIGLAIVYYGMRKVRKNGLSPIGLICIAAVVGVAVYGI